MTNELDLNAYLERIGYDKELAATLPVLRVLSQHHIESIAFEGLNAFVGLPIPLDLVSLQEKLVKSGRGGYCFEHNILFSAVLRAIGFNVTWLSARVVWNVPEGSSLPRTHMVLLVGLDKDKFLVDVGYGGLTVTAPIKLIPNVTQETSHEPFRLLAEDGKYLLQAQFVGKWHSLYWFDLQEQILADYEMANWYVSTHPDSRFVKGFVAAKVAPGKRYALLNNNLAIHHLGGETERRLLSSIAELRTVLENDFIINLAAVPNLNVVLQAIIERGQK